MHAPLLTCVGLMSGTSMDGIDAALVRTDGVRRVEPVGFLSVPYAPEFRARLRAVLGEAVTDATAAVERDLTDLHAEAVRRLLEATGVAAPAVDLVGFHGHTTFHAPARRLTRQIGDGPRLAAALGIPVVNDFRTADVAAGGQGAPLVPLFHQALSAGLERPLAVLNIGGVANVTWLGRGEDEVLAFDTGPGNALIDDLVLARTGRAFDAGGALGGAGQADRQVLARLMESAYFRKGPPKSLDRDEWTAAAVAHLPTEEAAATLTAFTAESVAHALDHVPEAPLRWLVTGGGRLNATLMGMLEDRLRVPVQPVEAVGWDGDALEAQAFAFLAVRTCLGLPLSLPGTTGAPRPMSGGRFHPVPD